MIQKRHQKSIVFDAFKCTTIPFTPLGENRYYFLSFIFNTFSSGIFKSLQISETG